MRILLTTDTVGGVWNHSVTLAGALSGAGAQVLLAALGEARDPRLGPFPDGVEYVSRPYRLEWMPEAADDLPLAAAWLRELAEVWQADVVHLNQMAYAAYGFPAPVLIAVHSDVLSWFEQVQGAPAPGSWNDYARWVRDGLLAADAVVAPTLAQARQVARLYDVPVPLVVHNGVEVPELPEPDAGDDFLVLTVGRLWDSAKGCDVLDQAAGLVPDLEVHALGESESVDGAVYRPLHLRAHGRAQPRETGEWMSRAAVYVAASRYEPFGLAPLEAALHGCALLLSDLPSFRELWDGCAEFVPAGDPVALASALRELRGDRARVARLAEAARRRAIRRYGAERMANEYLALYRDLADSPEEARVRALALAAP
jgi:glycosyltransferase involved in cell wall biosynthesis